MSDEFGLLTDKEQAFVDSYTDKIRREERARIVELVEHQEVWNSLDHKWVHPTYCLTCRNIQRINEGWDDFAPTWAEEVQEMKKEWPE